MALYTPPASPRQRGTNPRFRMLEPHTCHANEVCLSTAQAPECLHLKCSSCSRLGTPCLNGRKLSTRRSSKKTLRNRLTRPKRRSGMTDVYSEEPKLGRSRSGVIRLPGARPTTRGIPRRLEDQRRDHAGPSNDVEDLQPLLPAIRTFLPNLQPGEILRVAIEDV